MRPRLGGTSLLSPKQMDSSFVSDEDRVKKYQIRMNVAEFEPQDISVRVDNGLLIVEADRKETTPKGVISTRKFRKTATIPHNVDSDSLVSTLSSDGIITIEGAVNNPPEYDSPKLDIRLGSTLQSRDRLSSWDKGRGRQNVFRPMGDPGVIDILGTKLWRLKLNCEPLESSAIRITLNENKLNLRGTLVQVSEGCKSTNEYTQDYTLPNNCDLDCIQAYLESGKLIVEAKLQDEYQPTRELIDIVRI
ncbi:uncharacterized protein LOC115228340 [Octopus sinensis]|uniref:Uncharacterized protein LOC115228340 n=1 Tax=Octopus sinensis TaxID=2607531 RepID=A0A6P7TSQ9_9MOLL|nr:uncharacterized protein LOC115228340 [Octopus sinensis]